MRKGSTGRRAMARMTALVLGLGALTAACGDSRSPVSPGGAMPTSLASSHNGNIRNYTATISPGTAAAAGSQLFTLVITNDSSSSSNQDLGYAEVVVPAGFSVTSISSVTASGAKSWSASVVAGVLRILANSPEGQNRLVPGESVTVAFVASVPALCDTFSWLTSAFKQVDKETVFTLLGSQPTVEVTGCSSAAQACSPGYWKQDHHFDSWSTYAPSTTFFSVFGRNVDGIATLLDAVESSGGGSARAARIGTAALLSAAHSGVNYPYTVAQVVQAVQDAIDGVTTPAVSIDDLENVWKLTADHCPLS